MSYSILEINLRRDRSDRFFATLHMWLPNLSYQPLARDVPIPLNRAILNEISLDPDAYGHRLTGMIFDEPLLRTGWERAMQVLSALNEPIRLRIAYDPAVDDLHGVRWELLQDPLRQIREPLALDDRFWFSRYLEGERFDLRYQQASSDPRALVIVANPRDLSHYGLKPLDVAHEVGLIRNALPGVTVDVLQAGYGRSVTLNAIREELRAGRELIYLLAHGKLRDGENQLFLENDVGETDRVPASDVVHAVRCARPAPALIVLASCSSAGDDDGGALMALGPQLVLTGVPAVIAMQGSITQSTVSQLLPVFFRQLRRDGQIDRALTTARHEVRRQADQWWRSVLFLGTNSGLLWSDSTISLANALAPQRGIRPDGVFSTDIDDIGVLQSGAQLQIEMGALTITNAFPARHGDGLTLHAWCAWDNTSARNVFVQALHADPSREDSIQFLAMALQRACKYEVAAAGCWELRRTYAILHKPPRLWLVQEWIEGKALPTFSPSERLPNPAQIRAIVSSGIAACAALAALHAEGVLHLRIRPDHLIVQQMRDNHPRRRCVLVGVTPVASDSGTSVAGDDFQAPEQIRSRPTGPSTDIYRLGAIIYALVTHVLPDPIYQHPGPAASIHNSHVPSALDAALAKALALHTQDRYSSAEEFASALKAAIVM